MPQSEHPMDSGQSQDHTTGYKLIACVSAQGTTGPIVESLYSDFGIVSCNVMLGRGGSGHDRSFGIEVEVLEIVVSAERSDEVFEYLYEKLDVRNQPRCFIYQQDLGRSNEYLLPPDQQQVQQ
ncbi:MAG: hypothetical protein GXY61_05180 [Lentisphaerae bacterium]|nr:hypothetical protein [Lentisphaerota bacterium]